jgi:hypothetical protein
VDVLVGAVDRVAREWEVMSGVRLGRGRVCAYAFGFSLACAAPQSPLL